MLYNFIFFVVFVKIGYGTEVIDTICIINSLDKTNNFKAILNSHKIWLEKQADGVYLGFNATCKNVAGDIAAA